MGKISDNAHYYVAGFGLYYIFLWVFTFYPAFIVAFTLQRMIFGVEGDQALLFGVNSDGGAEVFSLIAMVIGTFVILGLIKFEQWLIVLLLYLITAWPFLYILHHCWENAGEMTTFPLPLDWWPLW